MKFFLSIGFGMKHGIDTVTLDGCLQNSLILELCSIILDNSLGSSMSFNLSNDRFMRECICSDFIHMFI